MFFDRLLFSRHLEAGEEIIFDADRDNNGKGIPASEIIKMIEDINEQA